MYNDGRFMESETQNQNNPNLNDLISQVKDLPPLPNIVSRAMEIAHDPKGSVRELQILIAKDQALSAKILRIVNSAMYALRREVSTVSHAVSVLGIDTVFSVIMAISVENIFQSAKSLGTKLLSDHSWGTAIASRAIAKRLHYDKPEEAMVGGLMHDIGKPILMQNFPDMYNEIANDVYRGETNFHQAELQAFGFSHSHIGALLARKWNFPHQLVEAVGHHHNPLSAPSCRQLSCIVSLANSFMVSMGIGFERDEGLDLEKQPSAEQLKLSKTVIKALIAETQSGIQATSGMGK
jgi:putative nucleotidyltransferase with HDIG domain